MNLLLNAYEAIEPGAPEKNQITVTTIGKADRCGFVVEDTGRGIPDERGGAHLRAVLLDQDRAAANSGLGLPIVHEIVERLGGTIELDRASRGTRFYVELPRAGLGDRPQPLGVQESKTPLRHGR